MPAISVTAQIHTRLQSLFVAVALFLPLGRSNAQGLSPVFPEAPEKWSVPIKIDAVSDPAMLLGSASLTPDENTMYLWIGDNISVSHRGDSGWSAPRPLGLPVDDPAVLTRNPTVSPDGKTLYFSRYVGAWRLFQSRWNNTLAKWSFPVDMGDTVNLYGGNFAMTPDGRHLFFHVTSLPWQCTWNDSLQEWRDRRWVNYWRTLNCFHGLWVSPDLHKLYYDSFNGEQVSIFVHYFDTIANEWSQPMLLNLNSMLDTTSDRNHWLQAYPWLTGDMHTLYFLSLHDGTVSLWKSRMLVNENGDSIAAIASHVVAIPAFPILQQNYPNPFNPSTRIPYSVPRRMHVTLAIFNVLGQKVANLLSAVQEAGYHEIAFDASQLSSGVYYCRMEASGRIQTRALILVR